tara:strand:+ start:10290 stop:10448 length:159 start_codon:yes stop_codon:yes gene_type:complete
MTTIKVKVMIDINEEVKIDARDLEHGSIYDWLQENVLDYVDVLMDMDYEIQD